MFTKVTLGSIDNFGGGVFQVADQSITTVAKKAPDFSGGMVMVYREGHDAAIFLGVSFFLTANDTAVALSLTHRYEFIRRQFVPSSYVLDPAGVNVFLVGAVPPALAMGADDTIGE